MAVSDGACPEQLLPGSEVPAPRLRTCSLVAALGARGRTMDVNQPKQEHLLALKGTGAWPGWASGAALTGESLAQSLSVGSAEGQAAFLRVRGGLRKDGASRVAASRCGERAGGGWGCAPGLAGRSGLFSVFAVCRQASAVPTFFFFFNRFKIFFLVS